MDISNERKLASKAKELGESANPSAMGELAQLTRSDSPLVRRLAASAIGKLAGIISADTAVSALHGLLRDRHPQVRQYSAKALGAFGEHSAKCLPDLRDMYKNPKEKDYVKRSVASAGKIIKESIKIAEKAATRKCSRCGATVGPDEYARSMKAFERTYCDHCFDETYLSRRNYDTEVELNKTIQAEDGTFVQSDGERIISEWLSKHQVKYRYDERIRIIEGYSVRPDFYLPEFDLYIEYWGMDTIDYKIGMLKKQKVYQMTGKRLVSLYAADKPKLGEILKEKLSKYIRLD
ncbi:MAG TPA: HEAT repeat domain-containing protein [Victivallales bacterium]|nr:HEAT repeat domain-containing protein [Victivallales bacterium]